MALAELGLTLADPFELFFNEKPAQPFGFGRIQLSR
jgi:hypothetical protein